ncbi:MAG: hypothetical protein Q4B42_02475, partial [Oscillospiraceae bacterium]|nr:hypothetical protein [Oscillospiraceae bacterium]
TSSDDDSGAITGDAALNISGGTITNAYLGGGWSGSGTRATSPITDPCDNIIINSVVPVSSAQVGGAYNNLGANSNKIGEDTTLNLASGTVLQIPAGGEFKNEGTISNAGTINVGDGTAAAKLDNYNLIFNNGTIEVKENAELVNNTAVAPATANAVLVNNDGAVLKGAGKVNGTSLANDTYSLDQKVFNRYYRNTQDIVLTCNAGFVADIGLGVFNSKGTTFNPEENNHFKIEPGSTKLTLYKSWLDSLNVESYTVSLIYPNGVQVQALVNINARPASTTSSARANPATGVA